MPVPTNCQECDHCLSIWVRQAARRKVASKCWLAEQSWDYEEDLPCNESTPICITPPDWCPKREEAGDEA